MANSFTFSLRGVFITKNQIPDGNFQYEVRNLYIENWLALQTTKDGTFLQIIPTHPKQMLSFTQ